MFVWKMCSLLFPVAEHFLAPFYQLYTQNEALQAISQLRA